MGQACLLRDVGERAVAVVVEEIAGGAAVAHLGIEAAAVDQEDVEPAVVVVVEERRAAAHLLEQELLVAGTAGDVARAQQAGGGGDVRERHGGVVGVAAGSRPGAEAALPTRADELAPRLAARIAPAHFGSLGGAGAPRRFLSSSAASCSSRLNISRALRLSSVKPSRRKTPAMT